jgi:hypothetical protein
VETTEVTEDIRQNPPAWKCPRTGDTPLTLSSLDLLFQAERHLDRLGAFLVKGDDSSTRRSRS